MVPLTALWLPVLLSAVLVFVASSLIHMVLGWHNGDYDRLPDEDAVMGALREHGVGPGDYAFPRPEDPEEMKSPEFQESYARGPTGFLTVIPAGPMAMGKQLAQWFAYTLVIGVLVALVAGRALAPGAEYMAVFHVVALAAFLGYAGGEPVRSIWWRRSWATTARHVVDGLAYALLTAGSFGWLWPA